MLRRVSCTIVLLLLAAAGCSIGEEGSGEGAEPLADPASATAQAEEVCESTRPELDQERAELFDDDPLVSEDATQSFERAGALLASQLEQLHEQDLPAELDDWMAELEEAAEAYQQAGESTEAADQLAGGEDPLLEAERMADELGMEACGTEHQTDPDLSPPPES